jgi:opacity protein-like surface antigen
MSNNHLRFNISGNCPVRAHVCVLLWQGTLRAERLTEYAMKKQLLTLMLLSSLSGVASASDFDWTGGYIGLTAASHSGESDSATVVSGSWSIESQALQNEVATRSASQLDPDGTGFGIQGGYDYQFANNWVWGISAEYSKISADDARLTGPVPSTVFPSLNYTYGNAIEVDDSWAVRTRVGYAFGRSLVYLSAGWISVDVDASASLRSNGGYNKLGVINDDLDAIGWGLGWEYAFNDNWSMISNSPMLMCPVALLRHPLLTTSKRIRKTLK